MGDLKTRVQGLDPNISARDIDGLLKKSDNIYESLVVIAKRARQINRDLKIELHQKLDEFATQTDAIEEIHENKEQIEISKFYERLPNPVLISYNEFTEDQLTYTNPSDPIVEVEDVKLIEEAPDA